MARFPHPDDHGQWIDLIAFLAVLALGGILMAFGHATAGSLATVCAALGGLYTLWTHRRRPNDPSDAEGEDRKADRQPPADEDAPKSS
jgi:hypothetical protein